MTVKSKRIISIVLTLVLVAMLVPVAFAASSGSSWTAVDGDVTGDINDIVFGNNKFFAVTAGGERTSSTDGMTWLGSTYSNTAELYGLAYDGSSPPAHHYVHFGTIYTEEGEPESIGVWTSGGSSWSAGSVAGTDLALDANALLGGVAAGGGKMVAVGNLGLIIVSTDFGAHWSQPMDTNFATNSASLNGIVYGDNKFVAVGDLYNSKAKIITSADGTTWTSQTSAANSRLASIAYGNSTYVAVGDAGTIVTSTDGTNWTARTSNVSAQLKDVVFGNNGFVAVGSGGTILTSSNGTDWINRTNTGVTNKTLKAVAYGTGRGFVAGGEDGTLLISGLGVVYNGNGNNSGSVPTDLTFRLNGDPATVLGNTGNLEKTGFTFAGWNTKADGTGTDYAAAASLTIGSDDTILYAKWTANQGGGDNGG
ncbi:MAG: InlB B-repeat-containing protein, partial [Paenibacillaceae bacterium]|nr:InlB B-repeat-containing protein [Paenibacillaceae bacterium]